MLLIWRGGGRIFSERDLCLWTRALGLSITFKFVGDVSAQSVLHRLRLLEALDRGVFQPGLAWLARLRDLAGLTPELRAAKGEAGASRARACPRRGAPPAAAGAGGSQPPEPGRGPAAPGAAASEPPPPPSRAGAAPPRAPPRSARPAALSQLPLALAAFAARGCPRRLGPLPPPRVRARRRG